jgi:hypothetical protein
VDIGALAFEQVLVALQAKGSPQGGPFDTAGRQARAARTAGSPSTDAGE